MKLCIQTGYIIDHFGINEGYKLIREAGFEAIDWNLDHGWVYKNVSATQIHENQSIFEKSVDEILSSYTDELNEIKKNGLYISQAHAPFPPYEPGREDITDYAISLYKQLVLFCSEVGIKNLVIHSVAFKPAESIDKDLDYVNGLSMRMYRSLIPELLISRKNGKTPVTVCLENLFSTAKGGYILGPCTDPSEANYMIDTLNSEAGEECFGLCFDTGHLNLLRGDFRSYIPQLGNRIKCLHIHDNFQDGDRHLMPYSGGNIPWAQFLRAMKKIGYNGDISFETFAQYMVLPNELVPAFLKLNAEIGNYYRDAISGKIDI